MASKTVSDPSETSRGDAEGVGETLPVGNDVWAGFRHLGRGTVFFDILGRKWSGTEKGQGFGG